MTEFILLCVVIGAAVASSLIFSLIYLLNATLPTLFSSLDQLKQVADVSHDLVKEIRRERETQRLVVQPQGQHTDSTLEAKLRSTEGKVKELEAERTVVTCWYKGQTQTYHQHVEQFTLALMNAQSANDEFRSRIDRLEKDGSATSSNNERADNLQRNVRDEVARLEGSLTRAIESHDVTTREALRHEHTRCDERITKLEADCTAAIERLSDLETKKDGVSTDKDASVQAKSTPEYRELDQKYTQSEIALTEERALLARSVAELATTKTELTTIKSKTAATVAELATSKTEAKVLAAWKQEAIAQYRNDTAQLQLTVERGLLERQQITNTKDLMAKRMELSVKETATVNEKLRVARGESQVLRKQIISLTRDLSASESRAERAVHHQDLALLGVQTVPLRVEKTYDANNARIVPTAHGQTQPAQTSILFQGKCEELQNSIESHVMDKCMSLVENACTAVKLSVADDVQALGLELRSDKYKSAAEAEKHDLKEQARHDIRLFSEAQASKLKLQDDTIQKLLQQLQACKTDSDDSKKLAEGLKDTFDEHRTDIASQIEDLKQQIGTDEADKKPQLPEDIITGLRTNIMDCKRDLEHEKQLGSTLQAGFEKQKRDLDIMTKCLEDKTTETKDISARIQIHDEMFGTLYTQLGDCREHMNHAELVRETMQAAFERQKNDFDTLIKTFDDKITRMNETCENLHQGDADVTSLRAEVMACMKEIKAVQKLTEKAWARCKKHQNEMISVIDTQIIDVCQKAQLGRDTIPNLQAQITNCETTANQAGQVAQQIVDSITHLPGNFSNEIKQSLESQQGALRQAVHDLETHFVLKIKPMEESLTAIEYRQEALSKEQSRLHRMIIADHPDPATGDPDIGMAGGPAIAGGPQGDEKNQSDLTSIFGTPDTTEQQKYTIDVRFGAQAPFGSPQPTSGPPGVVPGSLVFGGGGSINPPVEPGIDDKAPATVHTNVSVTKQEPPLPPASRPMARKPRGKLSACSSTRLEKMKSEAAVAPKYTHYTSQFLDHLRDHMVSAEVLLRLIGGEDADDEWIKAIQEEDESFDEQAFVDLSIETRSAISPYTRDMLAQMIEHFFEEYVWAVVDDEFHDSNREVVREDYMGEFEDYMEAHPADSWVSLFPLVFMKAGADLGFDRMPALCKSKPI